MLQQSAVQNQVLCNDTRTVLAGMPENSVDTVVTSPPYRLLRNYDGAETHWGGDWWGCEHNWETNERYSDTPIRENGNAGFDVEDSDQTKRERWRSDETCTKCGCWKGQLGLEPTVNEFVEHLVEIFQQVERVLKPSGSLYVNIADSYADGNDAQRKERRAVPEQFVLAMQDAGWLYRERYTWAKTTHVPDSVADRAAIASEPVFRFTHGPEYYDSGRGPDTDILTVTPSQKQAAHTAMMPKELVKPFIRASCPPYGTVFDPFCGAGTVCVAAKELWRAYIGAEISLGYASIARGEIRRAKPPTPDERQQTEQVTLEKLD